MKTLNVYDKYIPRDGVAADIGGDPKDTTLAMRCGPWKVVTFNPDPVMNADQCYALGAAPGFARLQGGHLTGAVNGAGVEIKRLDDVATDWKRLDFVRLSVSGFEPFVLTGARQTLLHLRPVLYVAVCPADLARYHQTPHALLALLMSLGYATVPQPETVTIDDPAYDLLCLPQALPKS